MLNLISVVAALGAITTVFTRGWGASLLGLSGTGPVDAFLPVVMFSVLFGLSMDYEVYTVSRMQEEWRLLRSRPEDPAWRNHAAVAAGQAHSTRIVTAAAAGIMIVVFGSFLPGGHHLLQEFGFGLAFSVLIDAVLIRSMLLPAVMHLIGPANWYLPARLSRALGLTRQQVPKDPPTGQPHRIPVSAEVSDPGRRQRHATTPGDGGPTRREPGPGSRADDGPIPAWDATRADRAPRGEQATKRPA